MDYLYEGYHSVAMSYEGYYSREHEQFQRHATFWDQMAAELVSLQAVSVVK